MNYFSDRVKDTTTTTGTGNLTLSGTAPTGFVNFNSAFGTGKPFYYTISSNGGAEWEVGIGNLSASTTLVRSRVLSSSNSNALVNLSAGTKDVFVSIPAMYINDTETRGRMGMMVIGATL